MKTFNNIVLMTAKILLIMSLIGLVIAVLFLSTMAILYPKAALPDWFVVWIVSGLEIFIVSLVLFAIRYVSFRALLSWITKSE